MARCIRCGREDNVEYGTDGQPYCSSCIFYGRNRQCWRCRMYLPSSELQQYQGQWICPNCLINAREDERAARGPEYKKQDLPIEPRVFEEKCERCGRSVTIIYVLNGRRLCEYCLRDEQSKWTIVGAEKPPRMPYKITLERRKRSRLRELAEKMFSGILGMLGMRAKSREGEEIVPWAGRGKVMPFGQPLASDRKAPRQSEPFPESEGIIKRKPSKTGKPKSVDAPPRAESRAERKTSVPRKTKKEKVFGEFKSD